MSGRVKAPNAFWFACLFASLAIVLLLFVVSLYFGAVPIDVSDFMAWLLGRSDDQTKMIIEQLRLPRALLAIGVGSLLAVCGTATQGLFRNPLADPSLIGVTAGASAGASFVIVLLNHLHWSLFGLSLVSLGAFVGGLLVVSFVYRLASRPTGTSVSTMLLAGIAFTFLAGSVSSVFEFVADNTMLRQISLWRMGGLENADYTRVLIVAAVAVFTIIVFYRLRYSLNALLLGESEARHLGVDVDRVKKCIIMCVAAGVGTSVAVAGSIAFVGLIVPHMARMIVGPNHHYMIPMTACLGGAIMLLADTLARTLFAPTELPVGLLTSFIGAPVFILLLRRRHEYGR